MSHNPPQTLSIKRKRVDAPVDALLIEHTVKKQKSQTPETAPKASPGARFYFKRLTKPSDAPLQTPTPPTPTAERRFHLQPTIGPKRKHVFVEARASSQEQNGSSTAQPQTPTIEPPSASTPRPRKRPGASSAIQPTAKPPAAQKPTSAEPTEKDVRNLEAFSQQIEKQDNLHIPLPSPSKHKPKPPAQRFHERHPEKAAQLAAQDAHNTPSEADAMEIDTDEYVYDTYIREPLLDSTTPTTLGTVGLLVIAAEDEEWWNGSDSSDKEFDTDDEDENAEDYYANDYPEDELSEDDEFGRNVYQKKYRHGSDDEEYNLGDSDEDLALGSDEDEDDLHYKMTVPKVKRTGYWGKIGE